MITRAHARARRRPTPMVAHPARLVANVVTSLHAPRQAHAAHVVDPVTDLQPRDMCRADDISKRVIEVLLREALRRATTSCSSGDDANTDKELSEQITTACEELYVDQTVVKRSRNTNARTRRAIFPMMSARRRPWSTPLDPTATIMSIKRCIVLVSRASCIPSSSTATSTIRSSGPPVYLSLHPVVRGGRDGTPMTYIHESRLVVMRASKSRGSRNRGTLLASATTFSPRCIAC